MKEWEYTFDPVSKAEWIRQVTSDLRQKPVETLISEWWEGEPRWPLLHAEDLQNGSIRLPDFLFTQPPLLMENISAISFPPDSVNKTILNALQYGAQSIILQVATTEHDFNAQWTRDVQLGWITFQIQPVRIHQESLQSYLANLPAHIFLRLSRGNSPDPLSNVLASNNPGSQPGLYSVRFVYQFPSSGNWIENTSSAFNSLIHDLHQWEVLGQESSAFFNQCVLSMEAGQDYFMQIIQTKTLHVIWQNLAACFKIEAMHGKNVYLETHIGQKEEEKPDLFLIRASMSALAASLSGTGALCIHPSTEEGIPVFYQRVNRNIHHLLELESGMYKGKDPLAGAYGLDFHIKRWSERIWDNLNL